VLFTQSRCKRQILACRSSTVRTETARLPQQKDVIGQIFSPRLYLGLLAVRASETPGTLLVLPRETPASISSPLTHTPTVFPLTKSRSGTLVQAGTPRITAHMSNSWSFSPARAVVLHRPHGELHFRSGWRGATRASSPKPLDARYRTRHHITDNLTKWR